MLNIILTDNGNPIAPYWRRERLKFVAHIRRGLLCTQALIHAKYYIFLMVTYVRFPMYILRTASSPP